MAVDITKRETPVQGNSVINLDKRGSTLSLDKKTGFDKIVVNLNWNQGKPQKVGFLKSLFGGESKTGVDLDLGCLFELKNGQKGCVQALGNAFGDYRNAPYIHLLGDDRTGANQNGEFMWINGAFFSQIKRIVIYAFIYEGVASWGETDGVITVQTPGHDTIQVAMDSNADLPLCAIAMIENDHDNLKITKLVEFFSDQEKLDIAYGWNMNWSVGSK